MTRVVLVSTYDMGRQPFALASAAAWLRAETDAEVRCLDLDAEPPGPDALAGANVVAFYLPMHTATRLAIPLIDQARSAHPGTRLAAFGLYAPLNEAVLRAHGVRDVLGREFERELVEVVRKVEGRAAEQCGAPHGPPGTLRPLERVPDRSGLPPLAGYARLVDAPGAEQLVGSTETTRGCKHLCRHCPVVPVYGGAFQVVRRETVLADIAQQVAAGARHITFGDPDFFNGPTHGMAVVEALHRAHPRVTYDVTIKVEHLLRQRRHLPRLRETGCLFITTAVEALDDRVLALLEKGHTRADFEEALALCRAEGLTLSPTFVPFTPWTTRASYLELLDGLLDLGLVEHVPPIQLAIRLLITAKSRLLELPSIQAVLEPFDEEALVFPWHSPQPGMDELAAELMHVVHEGVTADRPRGEIFDRIRAMASGEAPATRIPTELLAPPAAPVFVPHLTEQWFC